jgi:archaeosine synthase beta-subunit
MNTGPTGDRYPDDPAGRTRWILRHRPPREPVDSTRPYAWSVEEERAETGEVISVATIFLTNRECPWHCLMCDLWRHTLTESVAPGTIPAQIEYALARLNEPTGRQTVARSPVRQVKLYNAGSFFDPRAIPPEDYPAIARRLGDFERVIVECHPSLIGDAVLRFRDCLVQVSGSTGVPHAVPPRLEVALGLETVHPEVLPKLNKRMTLGQFRTAALFLHEHGIALRAFVLVKPPFLREAEAVLWVERSVDFALDCHASVVSLIPTRGGNGAMERLAAVGDFAPPRLATFEAALAAGLVSAQTRAASLSLPKRFPAPTGTPGADRHPARVFADLWDLEKLADCPDCYPRRLARLREMNLTQSALPAVVCSCWNSREVPLAQTPPRSASPPPG